MKRFLTICLSIVCVVMFYSCATVAVKDVPRSYTYDGPFDPIIFFSWEIIDSWVCGQGHFHVLVKNPDGSDVPLVELMNVNLDGKGHRIVSYRYFVISEQRWHYFGLTPESHYEEIFEEKGGI